MKTLSPFHLAVPVIDLDKCRQFYKAVLGCAEGRSSEKWVDLDFFGHQLVIHQVAEPDPTDQKKNTNAVDGHNVPIPHFGVVLDWDDWTRLAEKLKQRDTDFLIAPYIRFKDEAGEQATMFFHDPNGNALEFKAFKNTDQLFAKGE